MNFQVSGAGGHICDVSLEADAALWQLKASIQAAAGISVEIQRLFHGQRELHSLREFRRFLPRRIRRELMLVRRSQEQLEWLSDVRRKGYFAIDWLRDSAPPAAREDRETILAAVALNPNALHLACKEVQNDHEVVLAAVEKYPFSLRSVPAPAQLWADREFVLAALDKPRLKDVVALGLFGRADEPFSSDREVVLAAVRANGRVLRYVSEDLKADPEVVSAAMETNWSVLRFASKELREGLGEMFWKERYFQSIHGGEGQGRREDTGQVQEFHEVAGFWYW